MVSFVVADARRLHVGSMLPVHIIPRTEDPDADAGPPVSVNFRVVGIEATPGEFPPQTQAGFKLAWLSPAFVHENVGLSIGAFGLEYHLGTVDHGQRQCGAGSPLDVVAKKGLIEPQAIVEIGDGHLKAVDAAKER